MFLHAIQYYQSHTEIMQGDNERLHNEVPYSQELNSASCGIQTQDLIIWSRECWLFNHPDTSGQSDQLSLGGLLIAAKDKKVSSGGELRLIKLHGILTLVLLSPDMPCLCKQCRSRLVG